MKEELKKIAEPESIDSIGQQLRSNSTAFHKTVRSGSMKFKEFKNSVNYAMRKSSFVNLTEKKYFFNELFCSC